MVFSSPLFIFLFLPVALTVYLLLPSTRARNFWLLLVSLAFYAWGEITFILLLAASTMVNYGLGLWVDRKQDPASRKLAVTVAVVVNIGLLAFFKYANFAVGTLNTLLKQAGLAQLDVPHIPLPIGISFFTFHALSYVIDVYRRKWRATTDPKDLAIYIFFFPQLIAGPILRWSAIGPQLLQRTMSRSTFAEGVRRFVGGLAKKVLIANTVGLPADQVFALPASELSMLDAWFGILCYTLQIYFDFSGYSDMAVGMGKMFGIQFLENFRFPYVALSIKDFWRRWHISLSSWFRDYLYIPLGGNRASEARNHFNLVAVFFLCGLWHGASWTFVAWGLYHGLFLVLERTRFGNMLERLPQTLRHLYTIVVVMMGWVIFRADTFPAAGNYFLALFGLSATTFRLLTFQYATNQVICAIILGVAFSGPLWGWISSMCAKLGQASPVPCRSAFAILGNAVESALIVAVFLISLAWLASGTYNPFIYYRF